MLKPFDKTSLRHLSHRIQCAASASGISGRASLVVTPFLTLVMDGNEKEQESTNTLVSRYRTHVCHTRRYGGVVLKFNYIYLSNVLS